MGVGLWCGNVPFQQGTVLIGQLDDRYANLTIPGLQLEPLEPLEHEAKAVSPFLASRFFYPVK